MIDESSKLTAVDEVFGGHYLTVFYCQKCKMVNTIASYNLNTFVASVKYGRLLDAVYILKHKHFSLTVYIDQDIIRCAVVVPDT